MGICRRLTAMIALCVQLIMTSVGALSACVDRPHTHAGVPAPDCAMHHQPSQPSPAAASGHHQHQGAHHHTAPAPDTAEIRCACPSDLMSYLAGEAAALPDLASIPSPISASAIVLFARAIVDHSVAPVSPPPRSLAA